eukprot:365684-Chlamydomonas_euryale.AAC.2
MAWRMTHHEIIRYDLKTPSHAALIASVQRLCFASSQQIFPWIALTPTTHRQVILWPKARANNPALSDIGSCAAAAAPAHAPGPLAAFPVASATAADAPVTVAAGAALASVAAIGS